MAYKYEGAGVVLGTVMASLASIERMNRERRRDESRFRENYMLQERRLQYASKESGKDRAFRQAEHRWKYLTDEKNRLTSQLETLSTDIEATGLTSSEWASMNFLDKTEGMAELIAGVDKRSKEDVETTLFDYEKTDKLVQDLNADLKQVTGDIKTMKNIKSHISQFQHELDSSLPGFYEKWRGSTPPEKGASKYSTMAESIIVDPDEMSGIYSSLKAHRPDMFGDIETNEHMKNLVRRNILPLYDTAIARKTQISSLIATAEQMASTSKAEKEGDIQKLISSLQAQEGLLTTNLATLFSTMSFAPGKEGTRQANESIKTLRRNLKKVEGMDDEFAHSISQLLVKSPVEQLQGFGGLINNMLQHGLSAGGDEGKMAQAQQLFDALKASGVISPSMIDTEGLIFFDEQWDLWQKTQTKLRDAIKKQTEFYGGEVSGTNLEEAYDAIFPPKETNEETAEEEPGVIGPDTAYSGFNIYANPEDRPNKMMSLDVIPSEFEQPISSSTEMINLLNIIGSDSTLTDSTKIDSTLLGDADKEVPPLFTTFEKPAFMKDYEFAGYVEDIFGTGHPEWLNTVTGEKTRNPHIEAGVRIFGEDKTDWEAWLGYNKKIKADYARVSEMEDIEDDISKIKKSILLVEKNYGKDSGYSNLRKAELSKEMSDLLQELEMLKQ